MRILYVSPSYTTHDHRFLKAMAGSRHEVWFLPVEGGAELERRPLPNGVRRVEWRGDDSGGCRGPEQWNRQLPAFVSVLERIKPNLVHAGPVHTCGWLAAASGFHPLVLMSWGSDVLVEAELNEFSRKAAREAIRACDVFLCDCEAVKDKAREISGQDPGRVVTFPWGIDLNQFSRSNAMEATNLRALPGWEDAFLILSTRSWEPIYGIDVVLESFRRAYQRNRSLRLVMLGGGSEEEAVHEFIQGHNLGGVIHLAGRVGYDRLPGYFAACQVYLSAAYSDGTSISLLEAMAMGLPVVVTDIPSNREWVASGRNGELARAGDADEFAQAIIRISSRSSLELAKMASINREVAEQRADWNVHARTLLDTYDRVGAGCEVLC